MTSSSLLNARLLRTTALGVSIAVAAMSAPAFAQDATTDNAEDTANAIVVTAQGRSQLLSDVPVAISAVSAETLQNSGANDIRQLNQVAPSLLVSSTGSEANGSARIRGIGTVGDNPGLESSVPVFIDGVYRSRSGIGLNELGEIDRVEVQRGPQGTLGGRNSSAGLISIYSKKPDFTFGANGEITYGNYDYWRLAGSITGPITDTLAARLDGVWVKRDGFYNDTNNNRDINNRDRYFLRGQLLFEPTEALTIRLIGDYDKIDENCCIAGNVIAGPTVAITNALAGGTSVDANNPFSYRVYNNFLSSNLIKNYGGSGQIDYDLGNMSLTSISAYREVRSNTNQDSDFTSADLIGQKSDDTAINTFTQELRLA